MPSVENILAPYAEKSEQKYLEKYRKLGLPEEKVEEIAWGRCARDMEQGFQGWEYKFNSVSSSRGDYQLSFYDCRNRNQPLCKNGDHDDVKGITKGGQGKEKAIKAGAVPQSGIFYDEKLHGPRGRTGRCI